MSDLTRTPDPPAEEGQDPPRVPDNELIVGLVAPVGVDLSSVFDQVAIAFRDFGYQSRDIHLTDLFRYFPWPDPLIDAPDDRRLWSYMNAGDELCHTWQRKDAMALLAISQVIAQREESAGEEGIPVERCAYVLRSLKRPEEVALLRDVYGDRFLLIGISATEQERLAYLHTLIDTSRARQNLSDPDYPPEALVHRDESGLSGDDDWGQNVMNTFHLADCFLDSHAPLREQLKRFFDVLFRDPRRSPRPDEFGMFQATAAAKRSAEMARQVGAAICTPDGSVVAVGTNEVPKAGGGLYWEGDDKDARDIARGIDASKKYRRDLIEQVRSSLIAAGVLQEGAEAEAVSKAIEASPMSDIIEFVRAVHAEMAALTDAARRGVSVQDHTLYVTTFPCHHCARHIVASGIKRVVYVSPYPKSKAEELHGDALVLGVPPPGDPRVGFEPFVGIGPRRYLALFTYGKRRDAEGNLLEYERTTANPRLSDRDAQEVRSAQLPYLHREQRALDLLREAEERSRFQMREP